MLLMREFGQGENVTTSACAHIRQACARGASMAGVGAGSGNGMPTRIMGEEA